MSTHRLTHTLQSFLHAHTLPLLSITSYSCQLFYLSFFIDSPPTQLLNLLSTLVLLSPLLDLPCVLNSLTRLTHTASKPDCDKLLTQTTSTPQPNSDNPASIPLVKLLLQPSHYITTAPQTDLTSIQRSPLQFLLSPVNHFARLRPNFEPVRCNLHFFWIFVINFS